MNEYISREELIDRLRKTELSADQIRMLVYPKEAVIGAINDCSSADVRKNIHGHWELDESDNSVTCDKCGCSMYLNDIMNGDGHFCPNCGADMREPKGEKGTGCTSTHNVLKR